MKKTKTPVRVRIIQVFSVLVASCILLLVLQSDSLHKSSLISSGERHGLPYQQPPTVFKYIYVNCDNTNTAMRPQNCSKILSNSNTIADITDMPDSDLLSKTPSEDTSSYALDSDSYISQERHDDTSVHWKQYDRGALAIFILSAIGINSTLIRGGYKREIKLNGWEGLKHKQVPIKCCVLWKNGLFTKYSFPPKTYYKFSSRLLATQYTCPVRGPLIDVQGVTLGFRMSQCPSDKSSYVKPFIAWKRHKHSFAICVKIVYGDIDVKNLVHWIEYYKELKVDKIFMFTYNISNAADRVMRRYIKEGLLQRRVFDFPWKAGGLKRNVGYKNSNAWQDEQVVVFDCFQRLSGYSHIAILDLDEFLLPRQQPDMKTFMTNLTATYPDAAGFTFKSYLFVKDWGISGTGNGSIIEQYIKRTRAVYTRQKNILIPSRVLESTVNTHEFLPKDGYERIIVPEEMAAVNHYRWCYTNLQHVCGKRKKSYVDKHILHTVDKYRNRTLWIDNIKI